MAWHIVERIIAWEFIKKRHQIRHKRAIDLSRNDKEKTASKKQEWYLKLIFVPVEDYVKEDKCL